MAGRKLGNNALWSVDEADACIREALKLVEGAMAAAEQLSVRGMRLQDLQVVALASDVRVCGGQVELLSREALGRLDDARRGVWRGKDWVNGGK